MRVALFSDLHANLAAFESCLTHARDQGFDQIFLLGDLVGYGPSPIEVIRLCQDLEQSGAIILRGNHDEVASVSQAEMQQGGAQAFVANWTFDQLDQNAQGWLQNLPYVHLMSDISFVHGTMDNPSAWHYATEHSHVVRSLDAAQELAGTRIVCCGHVHEQKLFYQGRGRQFMPFKPVPGVPVKMSPPRRWLATIGSVGQPRDGDPRASYAIVDSSSKTIIFFRVSYDIGHTVQLIHKKGLPPELARRLESGR